MHQKATCEPARSIIARLGGPKAIAKRIQVNRTTVWLWAVPAPRGRGGIIPRWHHDEIKRLAGERGMHIDDADLYGVHAA